MTFIGKLLVFLNLVLGVGIAVFATAVYAERPPWFLQTIDGGVDKGNTPYTFAQLKTDIDKLSGAATAASGAWSTNLKRVEAAEKLRAARQVKMFGATAKDGTRTKGLLDYAREGNPGPGVAAADAPGFYNLEQDSTTKLLNLDDLSKTVTGPDKEPLRGADRLQSRIDADAKAAADLTVTSAKLLVRQTELSGDIGLVDTQLNKRRTIRDHQLNEAAYLAAFEINLTEQRATAGRRSAQLVTELKKFGGPAPAGKK